MWSCATRSLNANGPAHTGCAAISSDPLARTRGDIGVPGRLASSDSSGAYGALSRIRNVCASTTSSPVIADISVLRWLSGAVRYRSMFSRIASAVNGSPSWNCTFSRRCTVSESLSSDHSHAVANSGTKLRSGPMLSSESHIALKTIRLV